MGRARGLGRVVALVRLVVPGDDSDGLGGRVAPGDLLPLELLPHDHARKLAVQRIALDLREALGLLVLGIELQVVIEQEQGFLVPLSTNELEADRRVDGLE
eukprot:scaffold7093_cov73-Phaeocystis_antarctica.AAC.3